MSNGIRKTDAKPAFITAPFFGPSFKGIRNYLNPDASQGMPKGLYADAKAPLVNSLTLTFAPVAKPTLTTDTTQDTPTVLLTIPPPTPFINAPIVPLPEPADKRRQNADTTQSTPKPFYGDARAPLTSAIAAAYGIQHAPGAGRLNGDTTNDSSASLPALVAAPFIPLPTLAAPQLLRIGADTSADSSTLFSLISAAPFIPAAHLAPIARLSLGADTSYDSNGLITAPILPFLSQEGTAAPDAKRQGADTSSGSPATLLTTQPLPPTPALQQQAIGQPRIGADTSRSTSLALFSIPAPFIPAQQGPAPALQRILSETSLGLPQALRFVPSTPFLPIPGSAAPQLNRLGSETSYGSAAALLTIQPLPPAPATQQQVVQPQRLGADTSARAPITLFVPVAPPFVPVVFLNPIRPLQHQNRQADTSLGMPKGLYSDSTKPFFVAPQIIPTVAAGAGRLNADTGTGTSRLLLIVPLISNLQSVLVQRRDLGADTSISSYQPLIQPKPFLPFFGPAIAQRQQWLTDTSIGSFADLIKPKPFVTALQVPLVQRPPIPAQTGSAASPRALLVGPPIIPPAFVAAPARPHYVPALMEGQPFVIAQSGTIIVHPVRVSLKFTTRSTAYSYSIRSVTYAWTSTRTIAFAFFPY